MIEAMKYGNTRSLAVSQIGRHSRRCFAQTCTQTEQLVVSFLLAIYPVLNKNLPKINKMSAERQTTLSSVHVDVTAT